MEKFDFTDIIELLYDKPRSLWVNLLKDKLVPDKNNPHMLYNPYEDESYPFDFESLSDNWTYNYLKNGEFLKDKDGKIYYVIWGMPVLDVRYPSDGLSPRGLIMRILTLGNTVELVYVQGEELISKHIYIDPTDSEYTKISREELPEDFLRILNKGLNGEIEVF